MKFFEKAVSTLTKMTGRTGLKLQAASPEILLVVGVVGFAGTVVLACRATLKAEEVLDEHKEKMDQVHEAERRSNCGEIEVGKYTANDKKKDTILIYTQTAGKFLKLYGPAVALGTVSIACLVGSHSIMKKRNIALMAAYQALDRGFMAYRQRVIEDFGTERDYMYKNGLREEKVTETETDEDGNERIVEKTKLAVIDPNTISPYAKFFDESSTEWKPDAQMNLVFLQHMQGFFNQMLQTKGHVFLNEVYDALGIPRTQAGAVVGWMLSKNGDNYISFNLYNPESEKARDFVNGYERSILLDFNVDGVIWNLFTNEKA